MQETFLPAGVGEFLASRRGWFWILSGAGLLLLVVVLVTWLRFGLVRVHYSTGDLGRPGDVEARAFDLELNRVTDSDAFTTIFGVALVPRSTKYVRVTTGNAETVVPIGKIPRFGFGRFDASLEPQRAADKLGAGLAGCAFSNGSGTYNYECVDPKSVRHYVRPERGRWTNETIQTLFPQQPTKVRPYDEGLLGLITGIGAKPAAQLFYAVPGQGEPKTLPVPAELLRGGSEYLNLETDTTDRSNKAFILYNMWTGRVVRYAGFGAGAETAEFTRKRAFDPIADVTQCAPRAASVYCYTGLRGGPSDSDDEDHARTATKPAVIEVFGSGQGSFAASEVFGLERFLVTGSGATYVQVTGRLYQVTLAGGAMQLTQISAGISAVAAGRDLFWATSTRLFRYDPDTRSARLVFSGAGLRLSELSARGDELIFNALVKDDPDSQLHTYLLGRGRLNGPRWEDKLPYSAQLELPIVSMDYTSRRMYVELRAGTVTTPAGKVEVNQDAFDRARDLVLRRLADDGFDPAALDISFTS